jgi:hypothetical protein
VIEFPVILHEIVDKISAHVSYAPSDTLQTLRLLKRYNFIRYQQLELPFPTEAPVIGCAPQSGTASAPEAAAFETADLTGYDESATESSDV